MTVNGKTYHSLGFLLLLSLLLGALPHEVTARHYMMRLTLKDKQGTLYSLQNPEAFLSQRVSILLLIPRICPSHNYIWIVLQCKVQRLSPRVNGIIPCLSMVTAFPFWNR